MVRVDRKHVTMSTRKAICLLQVRAHAVRKISRRQNIPRWKRARTIGQVVMASARRPRAPVSKRVRVERTLTFEQAMQEDHSSTSQSITPYAPLSTKSSVAPSAVVPASKFMPLTGTIRYVCHTLAPDIPATLVAVGCNGLSSVEGTAPFEDQGPTLFPHVHELSFNTNPTSAKEEHLFAHAYKELSGSNEVRPLGHRPRAQSAREPVLSGSAPGGPQIPDVLISYDAHVARAIWDGQDRGFLKVHQRVRFLSNWSFPGTSNASPGDWTILAERSALTILHQVHFRYVDFPLISAFVERWHPETNTFHLPWGEMTITLHDVSLLLGLPIDGDTVIYPQTCSNDAQLRQLIPTMFGWDVKAVGRDMSRGGLKLKNIRAACRDEARKRDHPNWVASGYLLYLLGTTIFIDKSQNRVKHSWLPLLLDHERTGKYAWGVAVLAYLYRSLGEASRANCKQLDGCSSLLQAWIWYHFPTFRGHLHSNPVRTEGPWAGRLAMERPAAKNNDKLHHYRRQLDQYRAEDVTWMPYGADLDFQVDLRVSRYRGILRCLNIVEPYHPDRVVRQFGRKQGVPLDVFQPIVARRGKMVKSYELKFNDSDDHWAHREHHLLPIIEMGSSVTFAWDVSEDYLDWYLPRTHPYIQWREPGIVQPPPARPVVDLARRVQIAVGMLRELSYHKRPSRAEDVVTMYDEGVQQVIDVLARSNPPLASTNVRLSKMFRDSNEGE